MSRQAQKHAQMRTLWDIQGGRCAFCAGEMEHPDAVREEDRELGQIADPDDPTLDHVIPRSRGGGNTITNLLLAHRRCNEARGNGKLPGPAKAVWRANYQVIQRLRSEAAA